MLRFILAWQVSWLAGRGLGPPSLPGWTSGYWALAHRLQSRGRLRLRVSHATALTEFPFRFHAKRRFSEHQAPLTTHFAGLNARWICDAIRTRNASFLASEALVAHKHQSAGSFVSPESQMIESFMPTNRTTVAILYSLLALVLFDAMGLIIKHLSADYGAAELSAYRNLFGLIPAGIALWWSADWHTRGRRMRVRQWRLALTRGAILTFAQYFFYLSLGLLSFATASTITYANALFMVALAVPLLREQVGPARWAAVLIGFVGVVMVVGPGRDTFAPAALLPLGAAACYALTGITARMMDEDVPTALINLYSSGVAVIGSLVLAFLTAGFTPLQNTTDLLWILGMGAFGGTAVLLLITAYRMTEQSNLAPFSYFGIPFAFVFGWMFYGETPWGELFPGALLIIVGGLVIVWRERGVRRG